MYDWSKPTAFIRTLNFMDKWYGSKKILINCDQGQLRSPTLALLYSSYAPKGIADYVDEHWKEIQ